MDWQVLKVFFKTHLNFPKRSLNWRFLLGGHEEIELSSSKTEESASFIDHWRFPRQLFYTLTTNVTLTTTVTSTLTVSQ